MDVPTVALIVVIGLAGVLVWASLYNTVVGRRNAVDNAFSSIDVMLKRRTDLIPNLVASVKQYMRHEAGLLERITSLRNTAISPMSSSEQRFQAEGLLFGALGHLRIAMDAYPDLRANDHIQQLQAVLYETEEQISAARRAFNATVLEYNNACDMLPYSVIANMNNFQRRAFFEIPEADRQNVDVGKLFA